MNVDETPTRTFLAPEKSDRTPLRGAEDLRPIRELPRHLLLQAAKRLRVVSLILASVVFLANFLGHLLDIIVGDIEFFQDVGNWTPGVATIVLSLLVYALARS